MPYFNICISEAHEQGDLPLVKYTDKPNKVFDVAKDVWDDYGWPVKDNQALWGVWLHYVAIVLDNTDDIQRENLPGCLYAMSIMTGKGKGIVIQADI